MLFSYRNVNSFSDNEIVNSPIKIRNKRSDLIYALIIASIYCTGEHERTEMSGGRDRRNECPTVIVERSRSPLKGVGEVTGDRLRICIDRESETELSPFQNCDSI